MIGLGLHRGAGGRPRRVLWSGTAMLVASLAWLAASAAQAQGSRLTVGPEGGVHCVPYEPCVSDTCAGGDACTALPGGGSVCATLEGERRDVVCCNAETTMPCPGRDGGTTGSCVALTSDLYYCSYPDDSRMYCGDGSDAERLETFAACFTDPSGLPVAEWALGDCDRDGVKNGAEDADCVCDDGCPGVEEPDAGPDDEDAGVAPGDGGAVNRQDAGSGDGPEGPGADPTAGIDYRGSGGCSCRASGGSGGVPVALALACLALAAIRRRP